MVILSCYSLIVNFGSVTVSDVLTFFRAFMLVIYNFDFPCDVCDTDVYVA
jgi:hypothetical protein